MTDIKDIYDITIIGGGPVGLFATFYAGMRQAKVKLIESLDKLGGQPAHLYPEKQLHDIPAYPSIRGDRLGEVMVEQALTFKPTVCLGEEVLTIDRITLPEEESPLFKITTPKHIHYSRTLIIAVGNGAFEARKLNLPQLEDYEKSNVHYFARPLETYRDQEVVVCGGGDSALDYALTLEPIAKRVTLVHRRKDFRAVEASVKALKNSSIEVYTPYQVTAYQADQDRLQAVKLEEVRGEKERWLDVDALLINFGFVSNLKAMRSWGLKMDRNSILVNSSFETSIPGIFAIGDVCSYPGKVKLIVSGYGEAPQAVNACLLHINPQAKLAPIFSTSLNKGD